MTLVAAILLAQAETPDYKHWASCKPGSWVRARLDAKTADLELTQIVTIRLLRLEKDAAHVEMVQRVYFEDNLVSVQVSEKGIPSQVDADLGVVKESEETLEIAGRKLACRRSDIKRDVSGVQYIMSFWVCPQIPGGTVKSEGRPAGEKAPSNRMTVLEWRKAGEAGVDEASTRTEAENILKKVEDTLVGAKTLSLDYTHTYDGTQTKGRFAREGDRLLFTFTQPRERGGPLTHTRISDGREFVLIVNGKRTPSHKVQGGHSANAIAVLLYAAPTSLDPWSEVEEGAPPHQKSESRDFRVRGRERIADRESIVLEFMTGKAGARNHVTLWVDVARSVPLKRLMIRADGEPAFRGRLEETYSNVVMNEAIDPSTFVPPKE